MTYRLDDFDFDLAPDRIALNPVRPRESARLLTVLGDELADHRISDLCDLLKPGDLIIVNDSRVIPARIDGLRPARDGVGPGAKIQANLIKRVDQAVYDALVRPAKRLAIGDQVIFDGGLSARVLARGEDGQIRFAFDLTGAELDQHLDQFGSMPLPPYIAAKRAAGPSDRLDYQTVYADRAGSVAAPTAGLHLSQEMLARLALRGIGRAHVTLHVGAGTFLPVKSDTIEAHHMHSEWGEVSAGTARQIAKTKAQGGRVVAIGTTALRLLESSLDSSGAVQAFSGETDIFIRPGYQVRSTDLLLTNFHLPRSTLLMLVAAFAGYDRMRSAYAHALAGDYRFFSYGDASLWSRDKQ